jgi:uncharacterized protein (TIRG00374 family)
MSPARRRWPRTVRRLAELLVVGFILEYFVVPQIGGTHKAIHVLAGANPFLPLVGLGLEALSLLAYFELTRSLIPKSEDPGLATVSRIQLSTLALSHCVPGGNAAASTLSYRLLTRAGVGGTDTAFALASQGLGSAVVLNVIFWLALVASLPIYGFRVAYLFVAILGLMLMAFIAGLVILMTKGDERAMKFVNAIGTKLRFIKPGTLAKFFGQLVARFKQLSTDRRQLAKAVFFASANWLFDAASLFVFLGAFGRWVDPVALLVAYGVANIAAAIPFTPGGLGVLELTLIGILVGFGPPRAIVILGVVAWRLVNFWLPIPVGGISYLSLRVHPPAGCPSPPALQSGGPCGAPAGAGLLSFSRRRHLPRSPPRARRSSTRSSRPRPRPPHPPRLPRTPRSTRMRRRTRLHPPDRVLCSARRGPLITGLRQRLLRFLEHPVPSLLPIGRDLSAPGAPDQSSANQWT